MLPVWPRPRMRSSCTSPFGCCCCLRPRSRTPSCSASRICRSPCGSPRSRPARKYAPGWRTSRRPERLLLRRSRPMPLTLTVTHRPRLRLHQETRESWQVLHGEARDLERQLETLWLSAFLDFRGALDASTLALALQHGALPTEHALWSAWHGVTQEQTRLPLLSLLQGSAERITDALTP